VGSKWERVQALWAEVDDLQRAAAVLEWDQLVNMPVGGAEARSAQLATLRSLAHARLTAPEMAQALADAETDAEADPLWLRAARRVHDREASVPAELVAARSRAGTAGYMVWTEARRQRNFAVFAPALQEVLSLTREYADALGWTSERYDALLSLHEPGLSAARLRPLFGELTAALVPLVAAIGERPPLSRAPFLQPMPQAAQLAAGVEAITAFGYDFRRGRQDFSVHPFSTSFGPGDCRITTRVQEDDFAVGFFATLHEAGHALYEQGIPAPWARGPLGEGCSTGVHESQSRLWENAVGRSLPFWEWFLPRLRRQLPGAFDAFGPEALYRAANVVRPSAIRVEADEVTYNLHIVLRFELEQALLSGDLAVSDLPAAWNEGMQRLLGIRPADDVLGVLQDVHWSDGSLAYFPSYTLGNVLAAQWMACAGAALPDLPGRIRQGDFAPLLGFLRTHIHRRGASLTPDELVQTVTGGPIDPGPYLAYLRAKYGDLYQL
jgi:carboxypeptidase Taq